ncbi:hypothetical protein [Wolbachia endosymbiont of Phyllotreta cruciferae]|uniref:hypothetical protein n=1 Tax=Wolbachia endosymbiont of Phyllotreta cruciferae TaxID=2886377 RepID=UPI0020A04894|nr:hypothetical protein [Wolbachia endosymbiont of Phyllotreta cruciferae]
MVRIKSNLESKNMSAKEIERNQEVILARKSGREVKNIFHKKNDTNKKDFILLGIKTVMNFPVISEFNNINLAIFY